MRKVLVEKNLIFIWQNVTNSHRLDDLRRFFITYITWNNLLLLGAIKFLENHVTRYFNTSEGYVVVPIGVGIVRIANENMLNCSRLEFTKSFLFVLDEALASKDAEVGDIWLVPGEELIRRLVVHRAEEEVVGDMNRGGNSFSPNVMGRLELIQHGSCHLNDRPVLPLYTPFF
jgi:hypothetical protein